MKGSHPFRFSLITYNLWKSFYFEERVDAITHFLRRYPSDIFAFQELTPESCLLLDENLRDHARVEDAFPGWTNEGNIYWNKHLFELVEYGMEDVNILEQERRLFWVRLSTNSEAHGNKTVLISTCHLTYKGYEEEFSSGKSPRIEQCKNIVEKLSHLAKPEEPVFLMGDFNDGYHINWIFDKAGLQSSFARLCIAPPMTTPTRPTTRIPEGSPIIPQTVDWIFSNEHSRVIASQVPNYFYANTSPSDHWPVLAVYEI